MSKKPSYKDLEQRIQALEKTVEETRRVHDALQESEERFRALADSTPVAIMLLQDDRWIFVNKAAEAITGYSADELLAMNFWDIVHPDHRELVRERGGKRQQGEATTNRYEFKIITKDGTEKWMDLAGASTMIAGRPAAVISVGDITERKKVEEVLRESEEKFRSLFDNAVEGVYHTTLDGSLMDANLAFARMLGYESPQEAVNNMTDLANQLYADPDDRGKVLGLLMEKGYIGNYECRMKRRDGTIFWVVINARVSSPTKGSSHIEGFIADITPRKQAETALWETQERFRAFMDNSPFIAWAKDEQGRHIYLNRACEDRFGVKLDDWYGKTDFELWPADVAEVFWKNDQMVLASNQLTQIEEETENPDGSRGQWWNFKFPFRDAAGRRYVGGIGLDITDRKRYEEKVKELNRELEHRVLELNTMNRQLEILSYSISHDLRTPLVTLEGFARILREKHSHFLDPKGRHYLAVINESAKRMGELIGDLLSFFSLGKQTISCSTTDMEKLVADIVLDFKTIFPDQNFRIERKTLPPVRADGKMLRQVLFNLIDNAIKYGKPKGSVTIEVGGKVEEGKNTYYVKDNGIGFPAEKAGKVFEVFERLHGSDAFQGTGIGLAVVKRIVERHGGEVWAEAIPGEGATFYFSLPV